MMMFASWLVVVVIPVILAVLGYVYSDYPFVLITLVSTTLVVLLAIQNYNRVLKAHIEQ